MLRTHDAGSLRASHAGQIVSLAGWVARRRDHGGVAFIDLRDATGSVQVVIREAIVPDAPKSESSGWAFTTKTRLISLSAIGSIHEA